MNQRNTDDLADALAQLIKHVGDAINHDVTLDIPPHSARICRVVERIEDAAFKRGIAQQRQQQLGAALDHMRDHLKRWDEWCDDCHERKPFCQCP